MRKIRLGRSSIKTAPAAIDQSLPPLLPITTGGSRSSAQQLSESAIEDVIRGAAASEARQDASDSILGLKELADRVELLAADFGKWEAYKGASVAYVEAFTREIGWHETVRYWVLGVTGVLTFVLVGLLVLAVVFGNYLFGADPSHARTSLIIASTGGAVVLAITALRGAFTTLTQRNAELPMPEHMKIIVEAVMEATTKAH